MKTGRARGLMAAAARLGPGDRVLDVGGGSVPVSVDGHQDLPRLEHAIGVIYRPETELASHYFEASLPREFDGYIWFEVTAPVTPLPTELRPGMPETYPFGL